MKNALKQISEAARGLFRNGRALALFFVVYSALLATLTLFTLTREATIKDLLVTLLSLIALPFLFFLLQAMCVTYSEASGVREVLKEALGILRRVVIVSAPFVILGILLFVLLGKIEAQFSPSLQGQKLLTMAREGETWPQVVVSSIRLVLFGVVFPLICIHLWIAMKKMDVRQAFTAFKPIISDAFSIGSVKTYVIGFGLFGVIPYFLFAVRTPSERAWLEISLVSVRVLLALSLMLVGWVITVDALRRNATEKG